MAEDAKFTGYFQAMLWTCTSCGYVYEGGQPKMECQMCEAYKTAFIDLPQHLEQQVREELPDLPPNHIERRNRRLELMKEHEVFEKHRVSGRVLPSQSGNNIDPTEFET
ncbi:MAG: rubredoxin-like domain-containing protein [Persicimonas sp.]